MIDGISVETSNENPPERCHNNNASRHHDTASRRHDHVTRHPKRARRHPSDKRVNVVRRLHERLYEKVPSGFLRGSLMQRDMVNRLTTQHTINDSLFTGAVVALRWSPDGQSLMSGGKHLTLHSYPHCSRIASARMPAEVYDAEFLDRETVVAGTSTGLIVLPNLPQLTSSSQDLTDDVIRSRDVTSTRYYTVIRCHSGSVFSVKPLVGMSNDVFYTASADRTVRLFDRRALGTCYSSRTCNNNLLLVGTMSYRSLAVNPANPHQFCVSHGPYLGVHDLRFCCTDHRAIVRRYDVPPFPRPRLGGSNRITHAVFNNNGTEILLNTRTIGALLISNDPSNGGSSCEDATPATSVTTDEQPAPENTGSDVGGHERVVITEDSSSNRIREASSSLGQLGSEITNWLAERGRADSESEREIERECERESNGIIGRYTGHRNTRTILKEAAFWDDKYVLSGSDCGRVFIWNKTTCEVLAALKVDSHTSMSVKPHPFDPVLACSGLDKNVQLLEPNFECDGMTREELTGHVTHNYRVLEEEGMVVPIPNSVVMRALSAVDPGDFLAAIL